MKNFLFALAALFAVTPAAAATNSNFTGPRIEATAGAGVVGRKDFHYGAGIGFDVPLGDRFTLGAEANTGNVFDRNRTFGGDARLGFAVLRRILVFGTLGYEDVDRSRADGLRYGGGAQLALTNHLYVGAQYRRNDEARVDSGIASLGLRF